MIDFLNNTLIDAGINSRISIYILRLILFFFLLGMALIVDFISKNLILKFVEGVVRKTKTRWDDIFFEKKGFVYISHLLPAIFLYPFTPIFPVTGPLFRKLLNIYIAVTVIRIVLKFIKSFEFLYEELNISRKKPIRGYIQVLEITTFLIGAVLIISDILGKSPAILLSGIGAATAVIMLIFKDTILGLVAGVQININNMVKIGDWIELPQHNVDGDVIEINLTTVKVRNFDKTISNIPITALVSDSFKNWDGMTETGGRRIKRSIYIDINSIKVCTPEMLEKYKEVSYISKYISQKEVAIAEYNRENFGDRSLLINGRKLTNIGTFRNYALSYLKNHSGVNNNMTLLVRQLAPTELGLPLEIYAFTNTTVWRDYENIQGDIFDHLLAVLPEFDLKVFQSPTASDFSKLIKK